MSVGVPLPVAAVICVGAIVAALTAAILLNRVARFQIILDRIKDVLALIVLAAVLSTAVSALIGTTAVFGGGLMPVAEYGAAFLKWWLGDMMGVLVVAPPLLSVLAYPNPIRSAEQAVEACGLTWSALSPTTRN
ncbi:MASE1 domain-containing protein [Paraburkholderia sp.]|uniref:MASE1 domain-containing protein n=1 Tax=Paraburkholderia sp. TaxID=1926495 RepID=UPI003C7AF3A8